MEQATTVERDVIWVGLDVHKQTVTVAVAEGWAEPRVMATVPNDGAQLPKLLRKLVGRGELRCAYEAGACGYDIYRMCTRLSINCVVIAPSLIPRKSGDRVKTDRRDALKLCRCLRNGDLTPVWIPGPNHEALRDLVRGREMVLVDRMRIRHRIQRTLLRQGIRCPEKTRAWGQRHRAWLAEVQFPYAAQQFVWREYLDSLNEIDARIARFDAALKEQAAASDKAYLIAALQILKGVAELTAISLVAELGDLLRFRRPAQLFSYAGLVPAEYSSGDHRHQSGITRTGNAHVRRILAEAAHAYRFPPAFKGRLRTQRQGAPQWLVDISWRAQQRLHQRYRALTKAHKPIPVALTAVARELLAFIWEIGQYIERRELRLAS